VFPSGALTRHRTRAVQLVLVAVAIAVPLLTLPSLPELDWWPAALGLLPWVVGKYVLCPLRWHALSESGRSRAWHVRAYAESELCGLLTPGHVGADAWRVRRLHRNGMALPDAVAEAGLDRLVGAIGLAAFVGLSATALPTRMLLTALGVAAAGRRRRRGRRAAPAELVPHRRLPRGRALAFGIAVSAAYQLSIVLLLLGTIAATGHTLGPLALLGAFGPASSPVSCPGRTAPAPATAPSSSPWPASACPGRPRSAPSRSRRRWPGSPRCCSAA
jgi:hypothetical protein